VLHNSVTEIYMPYRLRENPAEELKNKIIIKLHADKIQKRMFWTVTRINKIKLTLLHMGYIHNLYWDCYIWDTSTICTETVTYGVHLQSVLRLLHMGYIHNLYWDYYIWDTSTICTETVTYGIHPQSVLRLLHMGYIHNLYWDCYIWDTYTICTETVTYGVHP
jgi:hypothetical protein